MSRSNMELGHWGDGTTRLVYWDYMHGKDRMFILSADGMAYEAVITNPDNADDDTEILTPVNLVEELRKLADTFSKGE